MTKKVAAKSEGEGSDSNSRQLQFPAELSQEAKQLFEQLIESPRAHGMDEEIAAYVKARHSQTSQESLRSDAQSLMEDMQLGLPAYVRLAGIDKDSAEYKELMRLCSATVGGTGWMKNPILVHCEERYKATLKELKDFTIRMTEQASLSHSGFYKTQYHGIGHLALAECLQNLETAIADPYSLWYSRCLPILQSSGMGKSRLIRQLDTVPNFIVLTLCLRPGESRHAYPKVPNGRLH